MLTLQEFGQSIKKKYPQYANVDDVELANKTLEKYPAYQSQVEKPKEQTYVEKVGGNLKENFTQGAKKLTDTVQKVYSQTENQPVSAIERVARYGQGAGNIAGTIAGTAGGILGSLIEPVLPEEVKKTIGSVADYIDTKINEIPGMTPELHKALGDVFNTVSLMGGSKASKATGQTVNKAAVETGQGLKSLTDEAGNIIKNVEQRIPQLKEKASQLLASEPDVQIKTILQETPKTKFDEFATVAEQSAKDLRSPSTFEKVGDGLYNATQQIKKQTSSLGQQKATIINKARVGLDPFTVPPRKAILKVMNLQDNPLKQQFIKELKGIKNKLEADRVIDSLQAKLYDAAGTKVIAEGSVIEKQLRGILGELNNELKKTLPDSYGVLNDKFANNSRVLGTLNRSLGEVVEGVPVRGATLIKQFFSPAGSKTKEIFDFVKKNTGIDLAQEAVLAKFMGELYGDVKVRSLLEGIPTSRVGATRKILDVVAEKSGAMKKLQQASQKATLENARKLTR